MNVNIEKPESSIVPVIASCPAFSIAAWAEDAILNIGEASGPSFDRTPMLINTTYQ